MLSDFPETKRLLQAAFRETVEIRKEIYSLPALKGHAKYVYEGKSLLTNYSEDLSHEAELQLAKISFDFTYTELLNNPSIVFEKLDGIAYDLAMQQTKHLFESVDEVSNKTGNILQRKGKITAEDILDMFDRIQMDFHADGSPNNYQIYAGPQLSENIKEAFLEIEGNPVLKKRSEDIIKRQRQDWLDRENNRKLVD